MRIGIVTPAPPGSRSGNRVTARRWARILKSLGHRVEVRQAYDGEPYDVLVALHARRSYESIALFNVQRPGKPVVVALTGTDIYQDLPTSAKARRSLEMATRIVALQPDAIERLEPTHRHKARVIFQSADPPSKLRKNNQHRHRSPGSTFDVCVIGHLRPVKDPFRAARAARILPSYCKTRILHIGGAMSEDMARRALAEMKRNPRYRWLGELPMGRTMTILARSQVCVLSSKLEGGANVISEAITLGVPVVASCIPSTFALLGPRYTGYFKRGDTKELARVLYRLEQNPGFLSRLRQKCRALKPLFKPAREKRAWRDLLGELRQVLDQSE